MANIQKLAEKLMTDTSEEMEELRHQLFEDYGIEPQKIKFNHIIKYKGYVYEKTKGMV